VAPAWCDCSSRHVSTFAEEFLIYHRPVKRSAVVGGIVLTMAAASGCSSTLAPGECRDGHDYLGRGPTVLLQGDCIVVGSDLQCHMDRNEGGYCAGPKRDVTTLARWVSTDSSVGVFITPGFFQARSNGATAIYAELDDLYSPQSFAYLFQTGQAPRQIGSVDISVWQTTTGGVLRGATVEFIPQSGSQQICQTRLAPPWTPCRFWSDFSPALVRASEAGYVTVEQTLTPQTTNLSYPTGIVLKLSPSP
jgi:hypothetical protein